MKAELERIRTLAEAVDYENRKTGYQILISAGQNSLKLHSNWL
jgi:hypothetical protein